MAATWNGTKWSSIGLFSGAVHAGLSLSTNTVYGAVSCPTSTSCQALGSSGTGIIQSSTAPYFGITAGIYPSLAPSLPALAFGLKAVLVPGAATISWLPPYFVGGSAITSFTVFVTSTG